MSRTWYLIDGYNLLHACGMARVRYASGELEKCRERLLNHIAGRMTDDERSRTTVVFDARDPWIDGLRSFKHRGMQIEFAPANSDADSLIETLIAHHASPRQLVVVSSDRRLKTAITRRRGTACKSEEFAAELDRRAILSESDASISSPTGDDDSNKPGIEMTAAESAYWEQVFSDVQPEVDAARPSPPAKRRRPKSS
ncbi:MAG: NYN domain-containing protein [Planctomycetaceae bacterium]|nr:NYN domain-containing protein [Planctomycetaceae bacterium]